jgi:hypothetical protein
MYPCPYCHTQLTWVTQYNQYYCYFCHRYVQAAPPPQPHYAPLQPPSPAYPQTPPPTPPADAPRPVPVGAASSTLADTPASAVAAAPTQSKPSIEYVSKNEPQQPVQVPDASHPARGEPIYLCKLCGSRLIVNGQRWYCPRCQQFK